MRGDDVPWLTLLGLAPLVGGLVLALLPRGRDLLAKQVALGFATLTLVVAVAIAARTAPGSASPKSRRQSVNPLISTVSAPPPPPESAASSARSRFLRSSRRPRFLCSLGMVGDDGSGARQTLGPFRRPGGEKSVQCTATAGRAADAIIYQAGSRRDGVELGWIGLRDSSSTEVLTGRRTRQA